MGQLANLANSLAPGEAAKLTTQNLIPAFSQSVGIPGGATGSITPFAEGLVWDQASRQVLYSGGDHHLDASGAEQSNQRMVSYSEDANSWSIVSPRPGILSGSTMHAWDQQMGDGVGNYYYFNGGSISKYVIATKQESIFNIGFGGIICGCAYFPELGGVIMVDGGRVRRWRECCGVNQYASGLNMGGYHNFAEYSLKHKVVIFGGGHIEMAPWGSTKVWKIDASASISALADAPRRMDIGYSIQIADPVSGNLVVFYDDGQTWELDPIANTWTRRPSPAVIYEDIYTEVSEHSAVNLMLGCPISSYGVILFVRHRPSKNQGDVIVYKHAQGVAPPATLAISPPTVSVQVNLQQQFSASGGVAPRTFSVPSGGGTINPVTGLYTAPATAGSATVRVTDSATPTPATASAGVTITAAPTQPLFVPTVSQWRQAFTEFAWTWSASAEPNFPSDSGYFVSVPSLHGDTEGDDLETYLRAYQSYQQLGYFHRYQAWKDYFINRHRGGSQYSNDLQGFGGDHIYGWGLVSCYEVHGDGAALAAAEAIGGDVESRYANQTPGSAQMGAFGLRTGGRHLILATRLAEATSNPRWLNLRNKLIDLWLQSPDWDSARKMYWYGPFDTETVMGTGAYAQGFRAASTFQIGILTEALAQAYRVTSRADIRTRLLDLASFALNHGLDTAVFPAANRENTTIPTLSSGEFIVFLNGSPYKHRRLGDPSMTTSLVNLLVYGYKLGGGDVNYLTAAKDRFLRGNRTPYGSTAFDGQLVVHHFPDTRFASSSGNFYLDYNKGEWIYVHMIAENGGRPLVEGQVPPLPPPLIPPPATPITVDSTFAGYSTAPINDGVVNAQGGTATTWASENNANPHFIEFDLVALGLVGPINFSEIYWAFNATQGKFMTSQEVQFQYWNGSAWVVAGVLARAGADVDRTKITFPVINNPTKVRCYQPANMGNPTYAGVLWVTEVNFGQETAPSATVTLAAPSAGANFEVGTAIAISATVTNYTGTVGFLADGVEVGTDATDPYSFNYTPGMPKTVQASQVMKQLVIGCKLTGDIFATPVTVNVRDTTAPGAATNLTLLQQIPVPKLRFDKATDNFAIHSYDIKLDAVVVKTLVVGVDYQEVDAQITYTHSAAVSEGVNHTFQVVSKDYNTNTASSSTLNFVVSTTPTLLSGTATWNPPSLADRQFASTTVTVTGAQMGDPCAVGFAGMPSGNWQITAQVTSPNTATVVLENISGNTLDIGLADLRVDVWGYR